MAPPNDACIGETVAQKCPKNCRLLNGADWSSVDKSEKNLRQPFVQTGGILLQTRGCPFSRAHQTDARLLGQVVRHLVLPKNLTERLHVQCQNLRWLWAFGSMEPLPNRLQLEARPVGC